MSTDFEEWCKRKNYKRKKFKRYDGYCECCGRYRLLDNHGKVRASKSVYDHDHSIIGLCRVCHSMLHSCTKEEFYNITGRYQSEFLE